MHLRRLAWPNRFGARVGWVEWSRRWPTDYILATGPWTDTIFDGFMELVRSDQGATTDHMEALIEASLQGGKAVVAAIQTALEPAS
jgi:hypothetical protein